MLKTPLYETHLALGAKMAPFGGWLMPIQYQGILAEHAHTREAVSVFDICHMGEFMLEADPALSGFDRIVTQRITSMPERSCRYGFMLNEDAGILDDLVVYRINKNNWMLVVNAATTQGDYKHLMKNLFGEYRLQNISDRMGKLDVQGPQSLDLLKSIFGGGLSKLDYYTFSEFIHSRPENRTLQGADEQWPLSISLQETVPPLAGQSFIFQNKPCIISRTGYTGELGYEIYISKDYLVKLWELLFKDGRAKPAGLGCRDTLRLEMGYPLYGQDLDTNHTPLSAGLARFVDFSKDFIGKQVLLKEQKSGPKEHLICFQADSRRAPRHGFAVFDNSQPVGTVTSGSFSPSLSMGIGMGYVSGNYEIGSQLIVKDAGIEIPVRVVKRPFIKSASLQKQEVIQRIGDV